MRAYNLQTARQHPNDITELFLQDSGLDTFPSIIFDLPLLKKLHITHEKLHSIPSDIHQLTALESLLLDDCQINFLPPEFFRLTHLRRLSLCRNQLSELPEAISQLQQLEIFRAEGNQLESLPAGLWSLPKLRTLSVAHNKIKKLNTPTMVKSKLKRVNAAHNHIRQIPKALYHCSSLEELLLNNNRIRSIREDITQLQQLSILALHYNRLKSLPDNFGQLLMLRECSLNNNKISVLPNSFNQLNWLSKLNLSNNAFDVFPEVLSTCPRLKHLQIANNKLSDLPSYLPPLYTLDASNNALHELTKLPPSLELLLLRNNTISTLPTPFSLPQLKQLDLSKNTLHDLPPSIRQCYKLEYLNLRGNNFSKELPEPLFMLESLQTLKGVGDTTNRKKILRFIKICKQREVPARLRLLAFDLLENKGQQLPDFSTSLLLKALLLGMSELALPIRQHLLEVRYPPIDLNTIAPGSKLYFLGATGYSKQWLKKNLPKLNVQLATSIDESIDYLVLGRLLRAMNERIPTQFTHLLSRQQFTTLANEQLGRTFATFADEKKLSNLRRLLFHKDINSRKLAIQLLQGGGVPSILLTDLFLAWKLNYGIGKTLENLLLQNVSERAMHNMYLPLALGGHTSHTLLASNIARYCKDCELDVNRITNFVESQ
jgi:Leucine-rich repeat (LRR) protein